MQRGHVILAFALLAACPERRPSPECPLFAEGDRVPYERQADYLLTCVHIETDQSQRLVFADEASWASFWYEHVTCCEPGPEPGSCDPLPPPTFSWEQHVLVGVFTRGDCYYSGCLHELVDLIVDVRLRNDAVHFATREVTREELGTCLACMQPRDFVLVDRRAHECYGFEFE